MKLLHNVPLHKIKVGIGFGYLALPVLKKKGLKRAKLGIFVYFDVDHLLFVRF